MPALDFPSSPTNGQTYGNYIYDSSITAWRNINTDTGVAALNTMGLRNVVPSSVVVGSGSATVNANGMITFSGASSVSLNGAFTSSYRGYKITLSEIVVASGYPTITAHLRTSGTNITTEYWNWGIRAASASGITQRGANATTGMELLAAIGSSGKYNSLSLDVMSPAIAQQTTLQSIGGGFDSGSSTWQSQFCFKNDSTSYDGITFTIGSSTMSGILQVYGYTN